MSNLVPDRCEIPRLSHQISRHGIAEVWHLIKTLHLVVVRITPGQHDIARWHAASRLNVRMFEPQALAGESIHTWCCALQFATKYTDRIATHIIHCNEQDVWLR